MGGGLAIAAMPMPALELRALGLADCERREERGLEFSKEEDRGRLLLC